MLVITYMSKRDTGFHEYVMQDLFGEMPDVTSRPMFSGWGIYQNGVIFAIIADGVLYFKADDRNQDDFVEYDSKPFTYTMPNGRTTALSYWELPEEISEDKAELERWIKKAIKASMRAKRSNSKMIKK